MFDLSLAARIEKNRLESDGAWIILLEIKVSDTVQLNICRNTENVVWRGVTWTAFPFEFDAPTQSGGGELPSFNIRVSNVTRAVQGYIEEVDGGVGAQVHMYVVLVKSDGTVMDEPFLDEQFGITSTSFDAAWVTFTASGAERMNRRVPERAYWKNWCPYIYKGPECRANSSLPECDHSLSNCRLRNNARRFGGYPSIPEGSIYAKR